MCNLLLDFRQASICVGNEIVGDLHFAFDDFLIEPGIQQVIGFFFADLQLFKEWTSDGLVNLRKTEVGIGFDQILYSLSYR